MTTENVIIFSGNEVQEAGMVVSQEKVSFLSPGKIAMLNASRQTVFKHIADNRERKRGRKAVDLHESRPLKKSSY